MKYWYVFLECAGRFFSWLCFSKRCCVCGKPAGYQPLCLSCRQRYTGQLEKSLMQNRCQCCGRLLLSEVGQCTGCRREDSLFRQFPGSPFPVFPYLGRRKRLLTTWKIQGDRSLSLLYARWVYTVLSERFPGIPVVPVPPRKNKMREKGWDQMEELCRILSAVYQVPVLRMLQRTTVIQQKKLNRQQRLGALGADYAPLPEKQLQRVLKSRPVPSEVVLLDDVMTTGATIIHATAALQRSGVEKVHPVTLFYVP